MEKLATESSIAPAMAHFPEDERSAGSAFCLRTLALMKALVLPGLDDEADSEPSSPAGKAPRRRAARSR